MNKTFTHTESSLIESCINGNRKSQKQLYNLYAPKMFGICLRYSKNQMDAENILQEGFLKLFNNLHRFKGDMPIDGWMQKIFINTAMEHIRRKTLETTTETHQAKPFLVSRQPVWIDFMKKIF